MRLSVLDQVPIREGGSAAESIRETFTLAAAADRWGYTRYWLAEHHNTGSLACAAPEILIPEVAARTARMRVGSGGVMLSHYSPLKVAETFRTLETLYPGRIDLGVGRAPGSDSHTAQALAHGPGALGIEHFPEQLLDLSDFLRGDLPAGHPFRGIEATPPGAGVPELWLLGSSAVGAQYAAALGWAFSFAHFITPEGGEQIVRRYRETFEASPLAAAPQANLGVFVICADTDAEAERLSWSRWCHRIMRDRGLRAPYPSVETALSFSYTERELDSLESMRSRSIHGEPERVRERLTALAAAYDVEELVIVTITHDPAARRRSYALLAEAFELRTPPAESAEGRTPREAVGPTTRR